MYYESVPLFTPKNFVSRFSFGWVFLQVLTQYPERSSGVYYMYYTSPVCLIIIYNIFTEKDVSVPGKKHI